MAPMVAIDINTYETGDIRCLISTLMRISPYPPNFNRIAASTIDPATGASTWAFGSHKWRENRGTLTMNAIVNITHEM